MDKDLSRVNTSARNVEEDCLVPVKRRLTPLMAVLTSKYTYITPKWR